MRFISSFCAAAALVLMTLPAHAITPLWSAPAKGCVPDEGSAGLYSTTGSGVSHLNNKVGVIRLVCPIDQNLGGTVDWSLVVTYRDSTGTAASANVTARVFRVSRVTGNEAEVAAFNSNSSTALGITKATITFDHSFNFDASYYYVAIRLNRTTASEVIKIFGIALESNEA